MAVSAAVIALQKNQYAVAAIAVTGAVLSILFWGSVLVVVISISGERNGSCCYALAMEQSAALNYSRAAYNNCGAAVLLIGS